MLLRDRRIGRFRIDFRYINDEPDIGVAVLNGVLVIRAEAVWSQGAIEYEGLHKSFAQVPISEVMPFYSTVVTEERNRDDGSISYRVEWIRQDFGMSHILLQKKAVA